MYNNIYPNLHTVTDTNILYKSNMYTITYSTLPYDKLTSYRKAHLMTYPTLPYLVPSHKAHLMTCMIMHQTLVGHLIPCLKTLIPEHATW